jgi:hypothetical protein
MLLGVFVEDTAERIDELRTCVDDPVKLQRVSHAIESAATTGRPGRPGRPWRARSNIGPAA